MTILAIEFPSQAIKKELTPSEFVKDSLSIGDACMSQANIKKEFGGFTK